MNRIVTVLAVALLVAPALLAEADQKHDCAAMMQQHAAMQKQMADMDARLKTLVDQMNAAAGTDKVDRMAAVLNELVAQHSAMSKHMTEMQPAMMQHMMEHMGSAKPAKSMENCPMMKGSKTAEKKP